MREVQGVGGFLMTYDSPSTRGNYNSSLLAFFSGIYPELSAGALNPREKGLTLEEKKARAKTRNELLDRLSLEYVSDDDRQIKKALFNFKEGLKGLAPRTIRTKIAAVISYLEDAEYEIRPKTKRKLYGKANGRVTKERLPTKRELNKMVKCLPIEGKALTLMMVSAGMRIGESIKLMVDDLDLEHEPPRVIIPYQITKTQTGRIAYMSGEAKEAILTWLKYRPEFIRKANRRGTYLRDTIPDDDDPRLFPFSETNFQRKWRAALDKVGILELSRGRVTIRPHGLRKCFRTWGLWQVPEIAEFLMGHIGGAKSLKSVYGQYGDASMTADIIKAYLDAVPNLTVMGESTERIMIQDTKIAEMSQTIAELKSMVLGLNDYISMTKDPDFVIKEKQEEYEAMMKKTSENPLKIYQPAEEKN